MSYVKAGTMSHLCLKCSCSDVMLFGWMNSGSITVYHRVKAPNENIVGLCMSFIVEMQNRLLKLINFSLADRIAYIPSRSSCPHKATISITLNGFNPFQC